MVRPVQLLRDVETRWSSTFMMIDRLLELYPAIDKFLQDPKQSDISHMQLTDTDITVLEDVRAFLRLPHLVQELLSADQAPTASQALPAYERLIHLLRLAKVKHPKIAHAIEASISALEQYMSKTRQTRVYALAMIINPSIKFKFLEQQWTEEETEVAIKWAKEAMLTWRKHVRENIPPEVTGPASAPITCQSSTSSSSGMYSDAQQTPHAVRAQAAGLRFLEEAEAEYEAFAASTAAATQTSHGSLNTQTSVEARDDEGPEERAERLRAEDDAIIETELAAYRAEALAHKSVDLLQYWKDSERRYPYLYRVALDILPVPASSVPCERVFSSSKETDTLRRTGLDAAMMEVLQVLKYDVKQRARESMFHSDLVPEGELQQIEVDDFARVEDAVESLRAGNFQDFSTIVHEVHGDVL